MYICKQLTIQSGCVLEYRIKSALHEVVETGRPAPCASTSVFSRCISLAPSFLSVFCIRYASPLYFFPLAQIFYFTLHSKIVLSFSLFLSLSRARR